MLFGGFFSILGFWAFSVLNQLGRKFIDVVHEPVEMKEMDRGYLSEARSYNYLIDIEVFLNTGRMFGVMIFVLLAKFLSSNLAYRIIVVVIGLAPLWGFKLIKELVKKELN
jgi:hypothetical protein